MITKKSRRSHIYKLNNYLLLQNNCLKKSSIGTKRKAKYIPLYFLCILYNEKEYEGLNSNELAKREKRIH